MEPTYLTAQKLVDHHWQTVVDLQRKRDLQKRRLDEIEERLGAAKRKLEAAQAERNQLRRNP